MKKETIKLSLFEDLPFIRHFFSTKQLHLFSDGDGKQEEKAFLKSIARVSGVSEEKIFWTKQEHGDRICFLSEKQDNSLISSVSADAIITNLKGVLIGINSADCCPILIADKKGRAIAAIHAGWKGTLSRIIEKTINEMARKSGIVPADLKVGIGPTIGRCCYNIPLERYQAFRKEFENIDEFISLKDGNLYADLKAINLSMFCSIGVGKEDVEISRYCTSCSGDYFYSYRREGRVIGRNYSGITMTE